MATSGSLVNGRFTVTWEVVSQSGYTSNIRWTLTAKNTGSNTVISSYDTPASYVLYVNGSSVTRGDYPTLSAGASRQMGTGTKAITRSSSTNEGSLEIELVVSGKVFYKYSDGSTSSDQSVAKTTSNTWTIESNTTFSSGASIISVSDFTDETDPVIRYTYSNYGNTNSTKIEIGMSVDSGASMAAEYRTVATSADNSITFTLLGSERQKLWSQLSNGTTGVVRFYIRTTETIGVETKELTPKYFTKTFTFVNYTPVITTDGAVIDNNSDTVALTKDNKTMVRYMSDAYINLMEVARKGATIANIEVRNGSQTVNAAASPITITGVDSNTFYFTVTDSRGYATPDAVVFNNLSDLKWVDYVKPTCTIASRTMLGDGIMQVKIKGIFFGKKFGDNANAATNKLTVDYLCNVQDEEGEWASLGVVEPTLNTDDDTYEYSFEIPDLIYNKPYQLTVRVSDELASGVSGMTVVTAETLFDWSKNDFRFNIPVNMEKGFTYPQWLLWNGAAQMIETDVIDLTEHPISSMPSGIVLVFSLFRDGAAADASIHTFYISKTQVMSELLSSAPHMFMMGINPNLSVFGSKYIYIEDNQLRGWVDNDASGESACGIIFDNSQFVLRYVIGV